MHLIFVADESVLPADHGGRLVMANDIRALRSAGHSLSLVVSVDQPQPAEAPGYYSYEFGSPVHFVPQRSLDTAMATHPGMPRSTATRLPDAEGLDELHSFLESQPAAAAVIVNRETSLLLGERIARAAQAPLLLRSQNDEIDYWRGAASDSASAAEAEELRSEADLLSGALDELLRPVRAVALISPDDGARYRAARKRTAVVPALVADTDEASIPFADRTLRVAFVGSLSIPHTAAGLEWYIERVWPSVIRALPGAELLVAGRGAPPRLVHLMERTDGVRYLGRVDDVHTVLDGARVFVNPVFKGSGVNMKLAQPAASGLPLVATTFGMRGAAALVDVVQPTDEADDLAQRTLTLLQDEDAWQRASTSLRSIMSSTYSSAASARTWEAFVAESLRPRHPWVARVTTRWPAARRWTQAAGRALGAR